MELILRGFRYCLPDDSDFEKQVCAPRVWEATRWCRWPRIRLVKSAGGGGLKFARAPEMGWWMVNGDVLPLGAELREWLALRPGDAVEVAVEEVSCVTTTS